MVLITLLIPHIVRAIILNFETENFSFDTKISNLKKIII